MGRCLCKTQDSGGDLTRQGVKVMAVMCPLPVDLQDCHAQLQQEKGGITEKLQPKYILTSTKEFMCQPAFICWWKKPHEEKEKL